MKYKVELSNSFKKDYKSIIKRGYKQELLRKVVEMLASGEALPEKYKDHALKGNYIGYRECHIQPDWLLVYTKEDDVLILTLTRTGTHSDLF